MEPTTSATKNYANLLNHSSYQSRQGKKCFRPSTRDYCNKNGYCSDPVISPKSLYLPVNWCLRWTIVMLLPCLTISKRLQNPLDPYTIEGRAQVEAELEEDLRREFVRSSHVRKEDMVYKYPKKMFKVVSGPVQNKFQCYSCMSMSYQNNWDRLQHLYVQPKVFTDRCENPSAFDKMPTIECGSVCVSLVEANVEGGVFMGFKYIRGCINRILTHDFNLSALRTHRLTQVDVCRNMPRAVLFNNPKTAPQVFGEVNVCTCYGDRCNSGESAAALLSPSWRLAILATLIIQLISRISL